MTEEGSMASANDPQAEETAQGRGEADDIAELLLQSPAALKALGGALAPLLITDRATAGRRVSSQVRPQIPESPNAQPGVIYPPYPYPYPYPYPLYPTQGGSQYGFPYWYEQGSSSRQKSSLPGHPGCVPNCSQEQVGLLASACAHSRAELAEESEEETWEHLVDPNLSSEERRSLEVDSDQGDWGSDDEGEPQGDEVSEELSEFLVVALKQPMQPERRKRLTEKYPRPSSAYTGPPVLDKAVRTLVQKKKSIVSHDRFLAKLQRFTSDAVGPLSYLLGELLAGKNVPKKAVSALQAAICLLGNAFAALSVERRRCILQQLNHQLVSMAEEEYEHKGKLFGDEFGQS